MLKVFFLLFLSLNCFANTFEVIGGGLTYHIMADTSVSEHFSNKLSDGGRLIDNPFIGVSYTIEEERQFSSYVLFTGQNSFNEGMTGVLYEHGINYKNIQLGFAAGTYAENSIDWKALDSTPFYLTQIGNTGFVPLFGIVLNYRIPINDKTFLKFNNLLSPIITNSSLSYGWNF